MKKNRLKTLQKKCSFKSKSQNIASQYVIETLHHESKSKMQRRKTKKKYINEKGF